MYCFDFEFYLHISAIEREAQTWPQDYRPSSCLHPVAWRHRRVAPVTPWEAWNLLRAASGRGRLVLLCDQSVFWPLASAAGLVVGWGERPVCTSNLQNKNSWDQCLKKVDLATSEAWNLQRATPCLYVLPDQPRSVHESWIMKLLLCRIWDISTQVDICCERNNCMNARQIYLGSGLTRPRIN